MDLRMLLATSNSQSLENKELSYLRNGFGCIATAVAYLHKELVRHKDIKPGNILISDGSFFICDFGVSYDFSATGKGTTSGANGRLTMKYSAPEVINQDGRNESSDIWSLGCVFLEMITVVKGRSLQEMDQFLDDQGTYSGQYWCAPAGIKQWLNKFRTQNNDDVIIEWIGQMVSIFELLKYSYLLQIFSYRKPRRYDRRRQALLKACNNISMRAKLEQSGLDPAVGITPSRPLLRRVPEHHQFQATTQTRHLLLQATPPR
jgi:serine/threonine protein kinase